MSTFSRFRIEHENADSPAVNVTRIFIDDVEQFGVKGYVLRGQAGGVYELELTYFPTFFKIEGDAATLKFLVCPDCGQKVNAPEITEPDGTIRIVDVTFIGDSWSRRKPEGECG